MRLALSAIVIALAALLLRAMQPPSLLVLPALSPRDRTVAAAEGLRARGRLADAREVELRLEQATTRPWVVIPGNEADSLACWLDDGCRRRTELCRSR
jgi:hypothetical protein